MIKKLDDTIGNLVSYQSKDGNISFRVNVFEETVWLTQKQMAALFEKSVPTIR
jgi:hypothetical protein